MSSSAMKPTWVPFIAAEASEESLHFSLKLMTGTLALIKDLSKRMSSLTLKSDGRLGLKLLNVTCPLAVQLVRCSIRSLVGLTHCPLDGASTVLLSSCLQTTGSSSGRPHSTSWETSSTSRRQWLSSITCHCACSSTTAWQR